MATIDKDGGVHGVVGPVVYRTYGGKKIVQSAPDRRKQTRASISSASEFGLISKSAQIIRQAFGPAFRKQYDGSMINRLNSVVSECIRSCTDLPPGQRDMHSGQVELLEGFEFNKISPLRKTLSVLPSVDYTSGGRVKVTVQKADMRTALNIPRALKKECGGYRFRFVLLAVNYRQRIYEVKGTKDIVVKRDEFMNTQEWEFEEEMPAGSLLLLLLTVDCVNLNWINKAVESLNSKEFCPAAILFVHQMEGEAEDGYGKKQLALGKERGLNIIPITKYKGPVSGG